MISIGIIGARGFAGGELLRLCLGHPELRVAYVTSESQAGQPVADAFPTLAGRTDLRFSSFELSRATAAADAFFLSLPDGEAMQLAPGLLEAGKRIVDVSGDYRVRDRERYETWYKIEHRSPELLARAVYGLPELHPEVRDARLVANPGCYPTAALLALAPLYGFMRLDPHSIVIDAKSGVSGAGGRSALKEEFSFTAINQNLRAYSAVGHRHTAEIEQELTALAGATGAEAPPVTFTPHLLPITRGIYTTCYARSLDTIDLDALVERYQAFYSEAPFVRITGTTPPEIRHVVGANDCRIGLAADRRSGRIIVMAVIDNLLKGAAGQAVQNMNLMLGLPETAGLSGPALYP
jgi:N-acetyl-gamma-glutamyl-phosphate reductase